MLVFGQTDVFMENSDFIVFNQQLMTLLRSGVLPNVFLETLVEQEEKKRLKEVFKGLMSSLKLP